MIYKTIPGEVFVLRKGRLFLVLSAVVYGIIPTLSAFAYRGGVNGITLTFLRSALSLPVLYAVIRTDGRDLRLSGEHIKQMIILGVFGGAMPILLLYMSYQYIATGLATALHFVYPVIIVMLSSVLYRQRPERIVVSAVVVVSAGVYMYAGAGTGANGTGVMLALLSGMFYAFYVIYIAWSGLDRMDIVVVSFYVALITSIFTFIFGAAGGRLYFNISPLSWCIVLIISFASALCAMPLFQLGVRFAGAEEAGVFSCLEPVTSMILGALALGESMGAAHIMGGALIVFGVLIIRNRKSTLDG